MPSAFTSKDIPCEEQMNISFLDKELTITVHFKVDFTYALGGLSKAPRGPWCALYLQLA